jgi:hypothetical protein
MTKKDKTINDLSVTRVGLAITRCRGSLRIMVRDLLPLVEALYDVAFNDGIEHAHACSPPAPVAVEFSAVQRFFLREAHDHGFDAGQDDGVAIGLAAGKDAREMLEYSLQQALRRAENAEALLAGTKSAMERIEKRGFDSGYCAALHRVINDCWRIKAQVGE